MWGGEGRVMGCSAHRGHDSFGGQNSKASRVRGSSHYWSAPGRDSMSLSQSPHLPDENYSRLHPKPHVKNRSKDVYQTCLADS